MIKCPPLPPTTTAANKKTRDSPGLDRDFSAEAGFVGRTECSGEGSPFVRQVKKNWVKLGNDVQRIRQERKCLHTNALASDCQSQWMEWKQPFPGWVFVSLGWFGDHHRTCCPTDIQQTASRLQHPTVSTCSTIAILLFLLCLWKLLQFWSSKKGSGPETIVHVSQRAREIKGTAEETAQVIFSLRWITSLGKIEQSVVSGGERNALLY